MSPNVNTATGQMLVQTMLENANGHMFFAVPHHLGPPAATRTISLALSCLCSLRCPPYFLFEVTSTARAKKRFAPPALRMPELERSTLFSSVLGKSETAQKN